MPIFALGLVLVAALIHALWNFVAKKSGGDVRFALLSNIALCIVWAPVGCGSSSATSPNLARCSGAWWPRAAPFTCVYYVTLLRGYRLGDLSVVYPLARGTGPLLTAFDGHHFSSAKRCGWSVGSACSGSSAASSSSRAARRCCGRFAGARTRRGTRAPACRRWLRRAHRRVHRGVHADRRLCGEARAACRRCSSTTSATWCGCR